MGYILITRHKVNHDIWHDANGIYEYPNKSDFGNLSSIKRNSPDYEFKIIDKAKFIREYKGE
jgi:hypothetical protein